MKKIVYLIGMVVIAYGCTSQTRSLKETAERIHNNALTIDSHVDTPLDLMRGYNLNEKHDYRVDRSRVDFPRMQEGGLDGVFMAAFIGQGNRDENGNDKAYSKVCGIIDTIYSHLDDGGDIAALALTPEDAYRIEKKGKRIIFIGIENGYAIGNDIGHIREFYDKGARYMTLCHVKNNDICDSSTDSTEFNGLSTFGEDVVMEMNRVGMMIDVSHISDSSFYDVLALTKVPVIASHSCARAVCDNPRNLSDDMLKALAGNGGVIQVCVLSDYVRTPDPNPQRDSAREAIRTKYRDFQDLTDDEARQAHEAWHAIDSLYPRDLATVSNMVDHIDHIVSVAGIDHVGIGTDFDGGGALDGCRDVSQMGNITLELVRRGYSEADIKKIWGGNLMRVMKEVQAYAAKINREEEE